MDITWKPRLTGQPDTDVWARVNGCECIVYFYSDFWWFRVEVGGRYVADRALHAEAAKTSALVWASLGAEAVSAEFVKDREERINQDIEAYLAACPERREAFSPGYTAGFRQGQKEMVRAMKAHAGLDEVML